MKQSAAFYLRVSPAVHAVAKRLAQQMGVSVAEVYRRGVLELARKSNK